MTILELFRSGMDTSQIALRLRVHESQVYNRLHLEREEERDRGSEKPTPERVPVSVTSHKPRQLIRYAGYAGRGEW